MFLQALESVHRFSVACPSIYFGTLIFLVLVVSKGWYTLGKIQPAAIVSPAPTMAPVRPRCAFLRQSHAIMVLIASLVIVGKVEASGDMIVATLAVKVT